MDLITTSESTENTGIKQEIDHMINEDTEIRIKSETDEGQDEGLPTDNFENPFVNVQLQVKEELITPHLEKDSMDIEETVANINKYDCNESGFPIAPTVEMDGQSSDVKPELISGDALVSYDYPIFDDAGSMDSNEAEALNQVEACLQDDDIIVKSENDSMETQKEAYGKIIIKEESELTVTETHLISNKLINTTSTITNTRDGLIESQTTKTLVMEIRPMTQSANVMCKLGNPEEILPTCYDNDEYNHYEDSFQLNSITGNVLSLEQEAYSLLKAKKRAKDCGERPHVCPKCPKAFKQRYTLTRHMSVHDTIERRAMGIIRSQKTRVENRNKKLKLEADQTDTDEKNALDKPKIKIKRRKKKLKLEDDEDTMDSTTAYDRQARIENRNKRLKLKEEQEVPVKQEVTVKKEGYECTCGQIFQRKSRMETCLRSHDIYTDVKLYPCVSCMKQFKSKEELTLHRKRLHRKRFPCKFCPTDYSTPKELFKHLQIHQKVQLMEYKVISEVMKGKQELKCFMCSESYTELSDLKCHVMDDHKEPYSCRNCQQTFSKIIDFGNHTKTDHPEVEGQSVLDVLEAFSKLVKAWKCEECGLQFHEADKLALHQIEKHSPDLKVEPQFQCTDCRRVFITQKGLTSHKRVHHSTENVDDTETVEQGVMCLECRKICKDMNALVSHMRFHSPDRKYPCKFCDFRFATPEKRKTHAEIHTGDMKYVCFICEYQCSSENRLKQHKTSLKHANIKEFLLTGKPLLEEEQSTSKKDKIKQTLKKKEWEVANKKEDSESECASESSEVPCDICGEKFTNESEMVEHKQSHPFIEFPNDDMPSRIFFK